MLHEGTPSLFLLIDMHTVKNAYVPGPSPSRWENLHGGPLLAAWNPPGVQHSINPPNYHTGRWGL